MHIRGIKHCHLSRGELASCKSRGVIKNRRGSAHFLNFPLTFFPLDLAPPRMSVLSSPLRPAYSRKRYASSQSPLRSTARRSLSLPPVQYFCPNWHGESTVLCLQECEFVKKFNLKAIVFSFRSHLSMMNFF